MRAGSNRLQDFAQVEDPPEGLRAKLLCDDGKGAFTIPFPCRRAHNFWFNDRTGDVIEAVVIGWREWETGEEPLWSVMTRIDL